MGKVTVIDAITGNVIEREQTDAEKAQATADIVEAKARDEAAAVRATQRLILLDRLGITSDEAALLLG